jgi:hypothetical protein
MTEVDDSTSAYAKRCLRYIQQSKYIVVLSREGPDLVFVKDRQRGAVAAAPIAYLFGRGTRACLPDVELDGDREKVWL